MSIYESRIWLYGLATNSICVMVIDHFAERRMSSVSVSDEGVRGSVPSDAKKISCNGKI